MIELTWNNKTDETSLNVFSDSFYENRTIDSLVIKQIKPSCCILYSYYWYENCLTKKHNNPSYELFFTIIMPFFYKMREICRNIYD